MDEELSPNFRRSEFACKGGFCCGHSAPISNDLIAALEAYRDSMGGQPLTINSGFRCLTHNRIIGSKDSSQHPRGTACDISGNGYNVGDMERKAMHFFNKVIRYSWGIHVDVRPTKRRRPSERFKL